MNNNNNQGVITLDDDDKENVSNKAAANVIKKKQHKQPTLFELKGSKFVSVSSDSDAEINAKKQQLPLKNEEKENREKSLTKKTRQQDKQQGPTNEICLISDSEEAAHTTTTTTAKKTPAKDDTSLAMKKSVAKISDYFKTNNASSSPTTTAPSSSVHAEERKVLPPAKPKFDLTEWFKVNTKLAFEDKLDKLGNDSFGDIAVILELYNLIVPMFPSELSQIEIKSIEYEHFISMLTDTSLRGKNYFIQLVRTFMFIFVKHEEVMPKREYYHIDLGELDFTKSCYLQEFVRVTLNVLLVEPNLKTCPPGQQHDPSNGFDLLCPDQDIMRHFGVMKKLEVNMCQEAFGDLNVKDRIEILKIFSEQLLNSKFIRLRKEELEAKLTALRDKRLEKLNLLVEKLEITVSEFYNKKAKYEKVIEESKQPIQQAYKAFKTAEKSVNKVRDELAEFDRLKPIGADSQANVYWRLSFLHDIVIEKKKETSPQHTEWYLFKMDSAKIKELSDGLHSMLRPEQQEVVKKLNDLRREVEEEEAEEVRRLEREKVLEEKRLEKEERRQERLKRQEEKKLERKKKAESNADRDEDDEAAEDSSSELTTEQRRVLPFRRARRAEKESDDEQQEAAASDKAVDKTNENNNKPKSVEEKRAKKADEILEDVMMVSDQEQEDDDGDDDDDVSSKASSMKSDRVARKQRGALKKNTIDDDDIDANNNGSSFSFISIKDKFEYLIEDLWINLVNSVRYFFYNGLMKQESYANLKLMFQLFPEVIFKEKFDTIKTVMYDFIEAIPGKAINTQLSIAKRIFGGEDKMLKGMKATLCRSNSLSQIYFLLNILLVNIRHLEECEKKNCVKCQKRNKDFVCVKSLADLRSWQTESEKESRASSSTANAGGDLEDDMFGFFICQNCPTIAHKACLFGADDNFKLTKTGTYHCDSCRGYGYESIKKKPEPVIEESDESDENDGVYKKRLRKTTKAGKVCYDENENARGPNKKRGSARSSAKSSQSSHCASSSASGSDLSSIESFKYVKRNRVEKQLPPEEATRRSSRLESRNQPKVSYAALSASDEENDVQ